MIAAKNSFIFNKHNLATLEIMNIPLLIRLPGLISLSEFLFKMPILAQPYSQRTRVRTGFWPNFAARTYGGCLEADFLAPFLDYFLKN